MSLIKEGKARPNAIKLHKILNMLKKTEFPWMYEVSKCTPQEALRDLEKAFKNFFEGRAGFPKFKKKKGNGSFRLTGVIKVLDFKHIQLPRLGVIRTKEKMSKLKGKILSATVKREADRWFLSLTVEVDREIPKLFQQGIVGLDCNVDKIVTTEGEFPLPRPLKKYLRILRRRSRQLSRKRYGSNNWAKQALKLSRLYLRIKDIRKDFYHKLSTWLAKTKQVIVVESLNIKEMGRNPYLSGSISDSGWGMFLRMLGYKTQWYGSTLVKAPSFYLSTKRCNRCGSIMDMPLSVRIFRCSRCGLEIDRDINAALNLIYLPQVLREVTPVEMGSLPDLLASLVVEAGSGLWNKCP